MSQFKFHGILDFIATVAIFVTIGLMSSGCESKSADVTQSATAASPAAGQSASAQPGSVKPTAEQEAARKQSEEMGPAIHAANEAAQKGN